MPEGDSVRRAATRLHTALAGKPLTRSDLRVPRFATADLTGRTTLDVTPRGKHLLARFEGGLTLHSHLRMDGAWHVFPRVPSGTAVPPTRSGRSSAPPRTPPSDTACPSWN